MVDVDRHVALVVDAVDNAILTAVASRDGRDRHFIGEAIVIATALFLMQQYCEGFLEGLGLKELAQAHGAKARELLRRIRSGGITDQDLQANRHELVPILEQVEKNRDNATAVEAGENAIRSFVRQQGATESQAKNVATEITRAITTS